MTDIINTRAADAQIRNQPKPLVTLTFTHDEAQFLMDILNRIGGCPDNSRRRHADDIRNALMCAPYIVDTLEGNTDHKDDDLHSFISCEDPYR